MLQFDCEDEKVEGSITVQDGSHRHSISGTWRGKQIQFWRTLSESSGQPFEGIAIQTRGGVVRMAGRFADRLSGVWSANCTQEQDQDQDSESGISSPDRVDVVLASVGDHPIDVIKIVREVTGLGLREAKDLVDRAPTTIKSGVSVEQARSIVTALERAGATVDVVERD